MSGAPITQDSPGFRDCTSSTMEICKGFRVDMRSVPGRHKKTSIENIRSDILDHIEGMPGTSRRAIAKKFPSYSHASIRKVTRLLAEEGMIRIVDLGQSRGNGLRYYPAASV